MKRRQFLLGSSSLVVGQAIADERPKPRIKIGQIGTSHAHASKLEVYRRSPDYEVVGVVEPDEGLQKKAEKIPAFAGLPFLKREELLNSPELQAVLVETHVRHLMENAEVCIQAGKHIHLDKPPGASLPRLRAVLESARKQKLCVQMGYMYRYNPGFGLVREFLKKGWLGEIFEVHAVMGKVVPPAERKELSEFKGGILFELGCHVLDLVIAILGKPGEVLGRARQTLPMNDGLSDNMLALLTYPKALATVRASAVEVEGFERRHLVVCGTEGTVHIQPLDRPAARVALSTAREGYRKGYQDVALPRYVRYVDDAADMARVIRGVKDHDYPPEHDLAVQETLLRACGMPLD